MNTGAIAARVKWELKPITREQGRDKFAADDLIDAYLKGRKDQADSENQLRLEKLESNLAKAQELSENIFARIVEKGFHCYQVRLKIKDIYHFSSIFIIDENDFCDNGFLTI